MILLRCVFHPPGEFFHLFTHIHIRARIQTLYTFPQSVGIASGRPSSYYFVGSQADSLFYLDPHHARPAVPLRPPPPPPLEITARLRGERQTTPESIERKQQRQRLLTSVTGPQHIPTPPSSSRTAGSTTTTSTSAPLTPSPSKKTILHLPILLSPSRQQRSRSRPKQRRDLRSTSRILCECVFCCGA
jgi:Peptidase family C54